MNKQHFLERIAVMAPSSLTKYSYENVPDVFKHTETVPITCPKHGVFNQRPYSHIYGTGCKFCAPEDNILPTPVFVRKSTDKFGQRFDYSKTIYSGKDKRLTITCPVHGDFTVKANLHLLSRHGCPRCDYEIPRAAKLEEALRRANERHNGFYDYSDVIYTNVNTKVTIGCPIHGPFKQKFFFHYAHGHGCMRCRIEKDRVSLEDFIARARDIHGDSYEYDKVKLDRGASSKVTITCKKHGDFQQLASSHLDGSRCRECFIESGWLKTEDFIKKAKEVHGEKYDYSRVRYRGSKKHVEVVCPTHGSFWLIPNAHVSSRAGCRLCYDSKGERAVEVALKKYSIPHIREYRILPHKYRYDFFIPIVNLCIEFHGHQHYYPVGLFGGRDGFIATKKRDEIKINLIKESGGTLAVISFNALSRNTVEREVLAALKRMARYWVSDNGEVRVFRRASDLCREYGLDPWMRVEMIGNALEKSKPNTRLLF